MTTGPGEHAGAALSRDGSRLAFAAISATTRLWSFAFDPASGEVGGGRPVTPPDVLPLMGSLTRDGGTLSFWITRPGERKARWEVWTKQLPDGIDRFVTATAMPSPSWSPDGKWLAGAGRSRDRPIVLVNVETREERLLPSAIGYEVWNVFDWSPDGRWILANAPHGETGTAAMWLFPVDLAGMEDAEPRLVIAHPEYHTWQGGLSPDGRWVAFNATTPIDLRTSRVYVVAASGGTWMPLADEGHWDDKPRWSPDGRTIYFISSRGGAGLSFNVWGGRFNPEEGEVEGAPFQITAFDNPGHQIYPMASHTGMALSHGLLVLPIMEASGSIWMLDGVVH